MPTDKPFNEQAAFLIEDAMNLIKQVLVKHSAAVLEEMRDQIVSRNKRISELEELYKCRDGEVDALAELNQKQFLELEYLRPIAHAGHRLYIESEEFEFDDGMGRGAQQTYWDDLASTFEPTTDAIEDVLNSSRQSAIIGNGGDSCSDAKPPVEKS